MRVLLDTNIILDLVLEREPFVNQAAALWDLHQQNRLDAYVSPITHVNVFYVVRKLKSREIAEQAVRLILQGLLVAPVDSAVLWDALASRFKDYEDATQHAAALAAGLEAIITRDPKDYRQATIPVQTPEDFLATPPPETVH